ncbi:ATP-binding protein [Bergeyella sp. RCAD1439]|uniref:ATP-binding protein n=1 Tax=Bergeyella anatis TaxID=3113737 RepID=UPI002E173666|nr:ATP-binding protein [Bergeyella sp. RCAD1439]
MKNYLADYGVSQEDVLALFEQIPSGMAMLRGEAMHLEVANGIFIKDLGIGSQWKGRSLWEIQAAFAGTEVPEILQKVYTTGEVYRCSNQKVALDCFGKDCYFDYTFAPMRNAFGAVVGVSMMTNNVTDRVEAQSDLKEMEFLCRNIIMESEVPAVFFRGEDLVVDIINKKAREAWGKPYEVVGMKLEEALPELEGQPFLAIIKEVYRTGKVCKMPESKVDFDYDGRLHTFYYDLFYKPIRDTFGRIYGVLNMGVDVTDRVKERRWVEAQERHLREVLHGLPMAVSVLRGEDLVIKISNEVTSRLWKRKDDDWRLEKPVLAVYPELEDHLLYETMKRCYETGERATLKEVEIDIPSTGETKYLNYSFNTIDLHDGEREVIMAGYDVTKEVKLREELMHSRNTFVNLADHVPLVVWTTDGRGVVDYVNNRGKKRLGLVPSEIDEVLLWDKVHPDDLEVFKEKWEESAFNGLEFEVQCRMRVVDEGENYRWFLIRGLPVKKKRGRIVSWMGICSDIHDMKMEQKMKDDFLGIASHELKTPLTSIKLYAQVLERGFEKQGDEKGAEYTRKMQGQVDRLTGLVQDLLDVTRIQNGQLVFKEEAFDFDALVEEVCQQFQWGTHRILFDKGAVGEVVADRDRLAQVMINFISNAVKYSPEADEVVVSTALLEDGQVVFNVKDFGIGISPERLARVFDQFYRADQEHERSFEGLGLGLYISSEIVKGSGGELKVSSELGKGSDFCFIIPGNRNNTDETY